MCEDCSKGLAGKPKKALRGNGYADGNGFDDIEKKVDALYIDLSKRAFGNTVGYILGAAAQENFEPLKENPGLSAAASVCTGALGKFLMIKNNSANGALDSVFSGMITHGGVTGFKALFKGWAGDMGIRGQNYLNHFRGFVPNMPKLSN